MPLYRKKPVMIEAYQWNGDYETAMRIVEWSGKQVVLIDVGTGNETLSIPTLEGVMTGSKGDFIIRGLQGEYYPCKPDIFEDSYEEVTWDDEANERLATPQELSLLTQDEYRESDRARTGG